MTKTILVEDDGPVRIITLNRPAQRNAIDLVLRVELAEAIEQAMAEAAVRALVLTGAGPAFCSGGDITTMRPDTVPAVEERVQKAQRVIRAIWSGPKPVIAAVEGAAFGAGLALALACDRVVAGSNARLSASFIRVGLAGDMGITVTLPARIGAGPAAQWMMFGSELLAEDAVDVGLVDAVVSPGAALAAAIEDAAELASRPALAVARIKSLLRGSLDPFARLDEEAAVAAELFQTVDFAEGVAAFQQRRPPRFGAS